MFCDVRVPGGDPYEGDPRWIMRRALKRAEEMGFDAYNIGPELEYFYFRSAKPESGIPEVLDEGGYFDLTTLHAGGQVEVAALLEDLGDAGLDRKSTRLNSSHQIISYSLFCLKKKKSSIECRHN